MPTILHLFYRQDRTAIEQSQWYDVVGVRGEYSHRKVRLVNLSLHIMKQAWKRSFVMSVGWGESI
jgi:hypothetical protein